LQLGAFAGDLWWEAKLKMNLTSVIVPSPQAVTSRVGEETVVLHLENGTYYGLNAVGTRVWDLVQGGSTLQAVLESLQEEYDVSEDVLKADLSLLIQALISQYLIHEKK
jgi:hypothetical protein